MALSHNTLKNYYEVNFALMHFHKYSLSEIENLMPWERELYVAMIIAHNKAEEERRGSA